MVTLPENVKKSPNEIPKYKKIWVYGAPYVGKTYFADSFPDALFLSTDGNTKFISSPSMMIENQIEEGSRLTKPNQYAWDYLKDILAELARGRNTYQTIVFDLVEDMRTLCRKSKYNELGISHESEIPGKAWDVVMNEFYETMNKAANMNYNIVFISHEDIKTEFMSKTGDNVLAINPNISPKFANKIAGMVDLTMRAVIEDGKRMLLIKSNEPTFKGSRIHNPPEKIPMTYEALDELYKGVRK